jgi:hypothetical protein
MVLEANLVIAIDPANIAFVTTPAAIVVALPTEVTLPVKFAFVVTVVAVPDKLPVTFPVNVAVIVPAEKLPLPSLVTIAFAVLVFVAVVALLGIEVKLAPLPTNKVAVAEPTTLILPVTDTEPVNWWVLVDTDPNLVEPVITLVLLTIKDCAVNEPLTVTDPNTFRLVPIIVLPTTLKLVSVGFPNCETKDNCGILH